jgi:putative transposase
MARSRRKKTPSFIAEFPLQTTPADEQALAIRLEAARHLYNACLGESLRRLDLMRQSKDWQRARALKKGEARTKLFQQTAVRFEFFASSLQKYTERCRDRCWIGEHLGSHDTQTTSLRAFRAVEQYAFGKRGRPRFKGRNRLHSIEGKQNTVIQFRSEPEAAIYWNGLVLPLCLDPKDKRGWQEQTLACRTKYVRVLRREIQGRTRWFAQLVQEGRAPRIREVRKARLAWISDPPPSPLYRPRTRFWNRFVPL